MIEYLIFYSINQQQQQNKIKMTTGIAELNNDVFEDIENTCAILWEEEYDDDDYDGAFTEDDQIWWRMRDHVCDELYTEDNYDEENTLLWRLEDMPMKKYASIYEYWKKHLSSNKNVLNLGDPNISHHLLEYMMATPQTIVLEVVIDLVPDICVQLADRIIEDRNVVRKKIFCEVSKLPGVVNELICEYVAE